MKSATFECEVIQDHGGAYFLRLLTGFGDPPIMVARDKVVILDDKEAVPLPGCVVPARILGSDPT
jgi:hypothetical protein